MAAWAVSREVTRIVVSRTLDGFEDGCAILVQDRVPEAIDRLKGNSVAISC
jgi:hypothetical protein